MLTVRLLRAPDYAPDDYFTVCELLQSFTMPGWTFIPIETEIDPEDGPYRQPERQRPEDVHFDYDSPVAKKMYDDGRGAPLSWEELFGVCDYYRKKDGVPATDFVILLTKRPNALNWFSSFDENKNIFIHTGGWDLFTQSPPKYPIAYTVIANVLRTHMRLKFDGVDECLHTKTKGCMNDFCGDKSEVMFKMRTADICRDCAERLHTCEVPDYLVDAALDGFESLRKQMLFTQGFKRRSGPGLLVVKEHYPMTFPSIGNLTVKLPSLAQTLYLFFLRHPDGVRRVDLSDHKEKLLELYSQISGLNSRDKQIQRIERLTNAIEGSFDENHSRINSAFTKALGDSLAKPYLISGKAGGVYKIEVPRERVEFI
jgi:hypothetical protein